MSDLARDYRARWADSRPPRAPCRCGCQRNRLRRSRGCSRSCGAFRHEINTHVQRIADIGARNIEGGTRPVCDISFAWGGEVVETDDVMWREQRFEQMRAKETRTPVTSDQRSRHRRHPLSPRRTCVTKRKGAFFVPYDREKTFAASRANHASKLGLRLLQRKGNISNTLVCSVVNFFRCVAVRHTESKIAPFCARQ
jgi:hypothetical protein